MWASAPGTRGWVYECSGKKLARLQNLATALNYHLVPNQ